jgi:hypothetical protein
MDSVIYADDLQTLCKRFNPLIENSVTGDKPKYIIVRIEDMTTSAVKTYNIKTKQVMQLQ